MSQSRRLRRRIEKQLRHAQRQPRVVVREAERVERLTYTRAQAAEARRFGHLVMHLRRDEVLLVLHERNLRHFALVIGFQNDFSVCNRIFHVCRDRF